MPKILIVDDSPVCRLILRRILQSAGHEVIEADNGSAAIELYLMSKPDLVFLDLQLHSMNGLEILEKLQAINAQVQAIVASADNQETTLTTVRASGAIAFISKPFTALSVLKMVNEVIKEGVLPCY